MMLFTTSDARLPKIAAIIIDDAYELKRCPCIYEWRFTISQIFRDNLSQKAATEFIISMGKETITK